MKIVILEGQAVNPGDLSWDFLSAFGQVMLYPDTAEDQLLPRCREADILLTNKSPITKQVLDQCPDLKLICVLATGYNAVDCQAAAELDIPVCNVPAYSTQAVAQFTFALLLELCNQVGHHDRAVHQGRWSSCPRFCFWDTPQTELAGKTMGIIGFGSIGMRVGKIAAAFGMEVLAYSRSKWPGGEGIAKYVDLDTLLARSDVVSLHCPLTEQTHGIIGKAAIEKMKDGAVLLNTARGPLLDEQAVADALSSGKLRGAAMDVLCREPADPNCPLLSAPNCIITPHMAWAPVETRQRLLDITKDNISAFLNGTPKNVVNM